MKRFLSFSGVQTELPHGESNSKPSIPPLAPIPAQNHTPFSDGGVADDVPNGAVQEEGSPSLDDLNKQKIRLLRALNSTISTSSVITDDSLIDDIVALHDESTQDGSCQSDEDTGAGALQSDRPTLLCHSTPVTCPVRLLVPGETIVHASKETVNGTPVIESVSSFNNLPKYEMWREGVSERIYFENLPASTGKYDQIRKLLEKVRVKIRKIQYEDVEH